MALFNIELPNYRLNELILKETYVSHYSGSDEKGAELLISEFFPVYMVNRAEDGKVAASERFASEFTLTLEKFTNYSRAIQNTGGSVINPFKDILTENNTVYIIRKKCDVPELSTFMNGHRMGYREAYEFLRPLLLFLSQAARSEIHFTFSLNDIHVNKYAQIVLDKTFSMEIEFNETLGDIMKVYYYLTVGKPYDPAEAAPKSHGVELPPKIEKMMADVLQGEGAFGGVDDFCKNFKFLIDQEKGNGGSGDGGKSGAVFKWVAVGLSALVAVTLAVFVAFVLIPNLRGARPNTAEALLVASPVDAPASDTVFDYSMLAATDPVDAANVLEGAFLAVNDELYFRSYGNGYNLSKRNVMGTESVLYPECRPAFLAEKDGYIYFADGQNGNKILRVNSDTGSAEIFSDSCSLYLCINGDYLYYTNHSDRDRLYRKNIQTLAEETFINAAAYETVTDGENIYFINGDKDFRIYRAATGAAGADGLNLTRLNDENSRNLNFSEGMLMYTADDGSVRTMTTDGRQIENDCPVKAATLKADGFLLVMTETETNTVRAFNLDTNESFSPGGEAEAAYAWTGNGEIFAFDRGDCRVVSSYN